MSGGGLLLTGDIGRRVAFLALAQEPRQLGRERVAARDVLLFDHVRALLELIHVGTSRIDERRVHRASAARGLGASET